MMRRLTWLLSVILLTGAVGCSPKGTPTSPPVQGTDPVPPPPVMLEVAGSSVRPGGTIVLGPGPHQFLLRFSQPVDAKSVQLLVEPTAFQVRPSLEQPDSAGFPFTLEFSGQKPDAASLRLVAANGQSGRALVTEPQVYQLQFSPPVVTQPPSVKPDPSVTVWAVDPTGKGAPEVLFSRPDGLALRAVSPDGRYWLFERLMGEPKGSEPGWAYLYDRQTDRLREAAKMSMASAAIAWSGKGFWVNWLVHLNLDLSVETYPRLREALGLTGQTLLAASFTPDGRKVALLAMPANSTGPTADLILANADGLEPVRVAGAVQPWFGKAGYFAYLSLSPGGDRAILMSQAPGDALIDTARPDREHWQPLLSPFAEPGSPDRHESGPPGYPVWAPDGGHLWFPGATVLTREGKVVTQLPDTSPWAVWNADGTALVTSAEPGAKQLRLVALDGQIRAFALPDWGIPVAFLPDGRVLLSRTRD